MAAAQYNIFRQEGEIIMETKDILTTLRKKHDLTQEQLADKLHVTRQAVSRWETGETTPGPELLRLLSREFDVSINTLLGEPRKLICQCCGMPLTDDCISREPDGFFNEEYCKWCYTDGKFVYESFDGLVDFLVNHMSNDQWPKEEARSFFERQLKELKYWKDR